MFGRRVSRVFQHYKSLAGYFGFEIHYLPKYWDFAPSITGQYKGRYVRIFSYDVIREGNDGRQTVVPYTTVHVRCDNPLSYQVTIGRASSIKRAWKTIKGMFIEEDPLESTEHEIFFEKFHVDANQDHFARSILDDGLRKEMLIFEDDFQANVILEGEDIFYTEQGVINNDNDVNRIRNITNIAVLIGQLVEAYHSKDIAEFSD